MRFASLARESRRPGTRGAGADDEPPERHVSLVRPEERRPRHSRGGRCGAGGSRRGPCTRTRTRRSSSRPWRHAVLWSWLPTASHENRRNWAAGTSRQQRIRWVSLAPSRPVSGMSTVGLAALQHAPTSSSTTSAARSSTDWRTSWPERRAAVGCVASVLTGRWTPRAVRRPCRLPKHPGALSHATVVSAVAEPRDSRYPVEYRTERLRARPGQRLTTQADEAPPTLGRVDDEERPIQVGAQDGGVGHRQERWAVEDDEVRSLSCSR